MSIFTCLPSFVSRLPFMCLPVPIHWSPGLAGDVQLLGCLSSCVSHFICLPSGRWCPAGCLSSFVSQSGRWCPALWVSVFTCFPSSGWWHPAIQMTCFPTHLLRSQAGSVRFFGCLSALVSQFMCLPWSASFVSLHFSPSCWWCLPFRMPIFTCPSCVSLSAWWCLALWMSVFTVPNNPPVSQSSAWDVFTRLKIHSSHSLAGWCPALRVSVVTRLPIHLLPRLAGGDRLSGCLSSLVSQFMCLPVSRWWRPALRMSLVPLN